MKHIGIIGAGFSGTMVAVHLIDQSSEPLQISIIDSLAHLNRGVAYNAYSDTHILNVVCGRMSAFSQNPNHFLEWVLSQPNYKGVDPERLAMTFLPRRLYGRYLKSIWKDALAKATAKHIQLKVIDSKVLQLHVADTSISLVLDNGQGLTIDDVFIATGNHAPGHPQIKNLAFYNSPNYYQNPWLRDAITTPNNNLPVLIIGNGLTMVDTVLAFHEQDVKTPIFSLSPNGFHLVPHREMDITYTKLVDELDHHSDLFTMVKLINKHVKLLKLQGLSAEHAITSIRPYTQVIWKNFSSTDKKRFLSRCRHLWNTLRHRIPMESFLTLQQLQMEGKLKTHAGQLIDIQDTDGYITVTYLDKSVKTIHNLHVSRVINCTGPENDHTKVSQHFISHCITQKILSQDELKLGIEADTDTFQARQPNGNLHEHIFVIGSNLKGELWESTSVRELRVQAEKLAIILSINYKGNYHPAIS